MVSSFICRATCTGEHTVAQTIGTVLSRSVVYGLWFICGRTFILFYAFSRVSTTQILDGDQLDGKASTIRLTRDLRIISYRNRIVAGLVAHLFS